MSCGLERRCNGQREAGLIPSTVAGLAHINDLARFMTIPPFNDRLSSGTPHDLDTRQMRSFLNVS